MKKFNADDLHKANIDKRSTIPMMELVSIMNGKMLSISCKSGAAVITNATQGKTNGLYAYVGNNLEVVQEDQSEFPQTPTLEEVKAFFTADGKTIVAALKRAVTFASKDELRPAMNMVLVDVHASRLRIVSTDGHRMFRWYCAKVSSSKNSRFMISPSLISLLGKAAPTGTVRFETDGKNVSISTPDMQILQHAMEEIFPHFTSVYPAPVRELILSRQQLLTAVTELKDYANCATQQVELTVTDQGLTIHAEDIDRGFEKKMELPVCYQYFTGKMDLDNSILVMPLRLNDDDKKCNNHAMGFRALYLLDVLKALNADVVHIYWESFKKAFIFTTDRRISEAMFTTEPTPEEEAAAEELKREAWSAKYRAKAEAEELRDEDGRTATQRAEQRQQYLDALEEDLVAENHTREEYNVILAELAEATGVPPNALRSYDEALIEEGIEDGVTIET
jgi:DNA polymerase III sliding clamp (beta) subunit (PCNA family)